MTTFTFSNSVLLNAAVAAALAILVWFVSMIPCVRRRPGLRHCLWVIVLLKAVTPPLVNLSILPNWLAAARFPTHTQGIPVDDVSSGSLLQTRTSAALSSFATSAPSIDWMFLLVLIAMMGTVAVVGRAMSQALRLGHALRYASPNDERLSSIAAVAGKALGVSSPPPVCVVAANFSPLLWMRWSGPLIVVPRRLSDQMTDEQLGCVLAHEIAHYLRRDHWTNLMSLLVSAVCWWNPVVWWARRELRAAQEASCDALVISRPISSRRKYAETVFEALEFLQTECSLLPALASGFGNHPSPKRRFELITNPLVNHRLAWWSYPVLLAALAVLPCLPSFSQAQDQESDSQDYGLSVDFEVVLENFEDFDGIPLEAQSRRVRIDYPISPLIAIDNGGSTTHPIVIKHQSNLGNVNLAFELESTVTVAIANADLP